MKETPCQRCKRELANLTANYKRDIGPFVKVATDALREELRAEERDRVTELEGGLRDAIARLNDFLLAFEGDPDPSENDTKDLVVRLLTLLDGAVTGG